MLNHSNFVADPLSPSQAQSLDHLFYLRCLKSDENTAYHYYREDEQAWYSFNWKQSLKQVARWQSLMQGFSVQPGDKIAIMMNNSPFWVFIEQAALSLGLVVVPLYINDRADNVAYIMDDADVSLLFLQNSRQAEHLKGVENTLQGLKGIVFLNKDSAKLELNLACYHADDLLPQNAEYQKSACDPHDLATIVYTSGTTGKPKGVMLTHHNILKNAHSAVSLVQCHESDRFLSFLPLSHMFERTAGYYIPMLHGAEIAYARSIESLGDDLQSMKPTILVTVPRIFERVYEKISMQLNEKSAFARWLFLTTVDTGWQHFLYEQGKQSWQAKFLFWPLLKQIVAKKVHAKLGGRLRVAISGGAPLSHEIAQFFIGLGLNISQGYGLTEHSPVISTNKLEDNDPFSVGQILPGLKAKISEEGELLIKSSSVMRGYLNHPEASKAVIDNQGWLHTGDVAKIENNHLYITGRLKDILVLSNGEKVPPSELEMAICSDPLFEQVLIVGESKPFLSAIVVINERQWPNLVESVLHHQPDEKSLQSRRVKAHVIERIKKRLHNFPGYEQIHKVKLELKPWTIENGLLTPTMKLKRKKLIDRFKQTIEHFYHKNNQLQV